MKTPSRTLFYGMAGATVLLALFAWSFAPRPVPVEMAEAALGPYEEAIDEDGRTRVRDRFIVSAPLSGHLQRLTLREGDPVRAGDALGTLTPPLSPMLDERSLRELRARAGAAESGLKLAGARVESGRVAVERASLDLRRSTELAQQGFVAPARVDADRLALQAVQRDLEAAQEGQQVARHELEQARAALVAVRDAAATNGRGIQAFALRSPVAGRVLKLHQVSESMVNLGTPLVEIGDIRRLEVVAEVLTSDALLARPGTPVRIERWGGPESLSARVRHVEPAAFTKVSALGVEEQRVRVVIDITTPADQWSGLGDAYRVGVRILVRSEPAVLRVPVSAVFPPPAGGATAVPSAAVFVVQAGRARLRTVEVAGRNGTHAWIRAGLRPGERVIVYPPASVSEGSRVQERSV